jgi:hypothetical protein
VVGRQVPGVVVVAVDVGRVVAVNDIVVIRQDVVGRALEDNDLLGDGRNLWDI